MNPTYQDTRTPCRPDGGTNPTYDEIRLQPEDHAEVGTPSNKNKNLLEIALVRREVRTSVTGNKRNILK